MSDYKSKPWSIEYELIVGQFSEADARLIAAAPDMLEMLEEIALQIRRGQDISEWYSEIADTIAKAKPDTAGEGDQG